MYVKERGLCRKNWEHVEFDDTECELFGKENGPSNSGEQKVYQARFHDNKREVEEAVQQKKGEIDTPVAKSESGLETDELGEPIYTSKWLKENTNIGGWLLFFLFSITAGGIITAVYSLVTLNLADYADNLWLASVDILVGIGMFAIAIYTLYAFVQRKRNAVFYGRLYVVLVFVTNMLSLFGDPNEGLGGAKQTVRGLTWGIIWLIYLSNSKQVQRVIPESFRKVSKLDWGVLASIIIVPFSCYGIGMSNISAVIEKRENLEADIRKVSLAYNERTDGKIIFTIPSSFDCQAEEIEQTPGAKLTLFTLNNDSIGRCILCSDYDSDTTKQNFEEYWSGWENEDNESLPSMNVGQGYKKINGNNCMFRITKYYVNGAFVYWRFYMLFDELSGKCCVVSCYDINESKDYVYKILESIRFK